MPPTSIPPMNGRPGTNGCTGCVVFDSTCCPIRVRLKPKRKVLTVRSDALCRYSAVKNWFRDRKLRGNCGKSVGRNWFAPS
jgi:hypothetical protein